MNDYHNMSYVMFENTSLAMMQIMQNLRTIGCFRNVSSNRELRYAQELSELCRQYLDHADLYDLDLVDRIDDKEDEE